MTVFETAGKPNPIFCHQEFLEKLENWRTQPIGKRAGLLLQRLAVDSARVHYKPTRGDNQGWRRSRLGGSGGNHFYAWWAPRGAAPLKDVGELPEHAILLRDIRHHDDHSTCRSQSLDEHYLPVSVGEMRAEEFAPAPWTAPQQKFAAARGSVRVLKGHPGSGKTTALLNAADFSGAQRVLYVTFSTDLAALARLYFDRFCDRQRLFHVVTFSTFLREFLGINQPVANDRERRRLFRGDLLQHARNLGPWMDHYDELYDEFHAHLIGGAVPVQAGRFEKSGHPRVTDTVYRARRTRFLGQQPTGAALEAALRLERGASATIAERYFPELNLAWRVGKALADRGDRALTETYRQFECIAIDECQDLTPLEAETLILLAGALRVASGRPASIMLAGDEAQTVRPTDFEWGWMNDLLHNILGTPQEFKLSSNLRSPRRIATIVNHVWDLYSQIEKRDRPSGTGFAEIEDDATDQVFYCTATPGAELNSLLVDLSTREGLALICVDDAIPPSIPEALRSSILTASEAKGLDFHTVCVLEGGKLLDRIRSYVREAVATADLESIRRRLAIDRLRVALSRPTERLIWLDIQPQAKTVLGTVSFLNGILADRRISPTIPATVLTALEEEQLDLEERVQRCQNDARQYLSIRPEIAWSRAQQAVSLLGDPENPVAVKDPAAREAANMTLAEVCLRLAMQRVTLPAELGNPNLVLEAQRGAAQAGRKGLAAIIQDLARVEESALGNRTPLLGSLMSSMLTYRTEIPPWLLMEIAPRVPAWLDALEGLMSIADNVVPLSRTLPGFYDLLGLPDAEKRKQRLQQRCIQSLIKAERHADAFHILEKLPQRNYVAEAQCLEEMGEHRKAAEAYQRVDKYKEALACYRSIPDFDAASKLIQQIPDHPAAAAYTWMTEMEQLIAKRPENFGKVLLAPEKKVLEQMLEQALGTTRKKAVPRAAKAPAFDPNVKRRVELYLNEHPERFYCDGCLSVLAQAGREDQVSKVTKEIVRNGSYSRRRMPCMHCWRAGNCTSALAKARSK